MDNESGGPVSAQVSQQLLAAFEESGLTYAQMMERTGLGQMTLRRIFYDTRPMRLMDYQKTAEALGLNLSTITGIAERRVEQGLIEKARTRDPA